jgi:predicted ATPase/DNA-binding winged helix-turn-helix (wHTH) protein
MPDDQYVDAIEIRPAERQVLVGGQPAALGARAFDLLMALYERRERVVGKNELLDLVWPGLVVEENNLQVQVSSLRKVLGPSAIATIPGRGYRFTLALGAPARSARPSDASAGDDGRLPVQPGPRTNLPAATPLIGRDDDLLEATDLMRRCPVVTIVGAGGIGKTRLALALAAADRLEAPDGCWWIELAPINDAAQVPAAIAGAMGLQLPGNRPAHAALAAALSRQRLLLVLDNCEHLAEAVASVVALLRAQAPGVRLLITSQESLKCVDEQVYRLGSLALPATTDPEEASRHGAVALFVARAHAVDPRFRLGPDNVAAVIDICRRLDGIPLAIELAAARVPLLGVAGLQSRLDQMFNVLTGVARMKLRRHQTLRAALEWSVGLLSDEERAVFRRLGVFAGGFRLELAQGVACDGRVDQWQVLDVLAQLIDKSLVIAEGEGEPRYRLLEPTRAFALEQLAAAGESQTMLRRHAEVLSVFLAADDEARWTVPSSARLRLLAELGNLRAAVDWAMSPAGDPGVAIRLLGHGYIIWTGNNIPAEGFERMMRLWPLPADLPSAVEAAFCLAIASTQGFTGREEKLQAARRAAELYRQLGDRYRLGEALCRVVSIGSARGNIPGTAEALQEAAAVIGDDAPLRLQALLAMVHGSSALNLHDFAAARAAFGRQAELYRRDGSEFGEYMGLSNVSMVLLDTGEVDAAIDILQRVLDGLQRLKAPYGRAMPRALHAVALALRGDDVDVLSLAREAFDYFSPMGGAAPYKPLMAAALHHARRGEAQRGALIGGYAWHVMSKETSSACLIDVRMSDQLIEFAKSAGAGASVDDWLKAGERLSQAQVAALAFEGARVEDCFS